MRSYTTHRGKDIEIFPQGNGWFVRFVNGGELPAMLSGMFTSEGIAAQNVESYIAQGKAAKNPNKEV